MVKVTSKLDAGQEPERRSFLYSAPAIYQSPLAAASRDRPLMVLLFSLGEEGELEVHVVEGDRGVKERLRSAGYPGCIIKFAPSTTYTQSPIPLDSALLHPSSSSRGASLFNTNLALFQLNLSSNTEFSISSSEKGNAGFRARVEERIWAFEERWEGEEIELGSQEEVGEG
ncbi:hypothetical protein MNV49_001680 [Pseudohyphozyma bogoriensis]|nr:hypothetical protein MNV49_001680 [Pseudohyphozyma bogoriensis]